MAERWTKQKKISTVNESKVINTCAGENIIKFISIVLTHSHTHTHITINSNWREEHPHKKITLSPHHRSCVCVYRSHNEHFRIVSYWAPLHAAMNTTNRKIWSSPTKSTKKYYRIEFEQTGNKTISMFKIKSNKMCCYNICTECNLSTERIESCWAVARFCLTLPPDSSARLLVLCEIDWKRAARAFTINLNNGH